LNPDPMIELQPDLLPDEHLLWSGRPRGGLLLRPSDALAIPFSLMWCGFAVFWEASVLKSNSPFFFGLWGIPFVAIGLYMVFGRFVVDAYRRARTFYGVTNQRVLIKQVGPGGRLRSLSLRSLPEINVSERSDGGGRISFGAQGLAAWNRNASWWGSNDAQPAFELASGLREVQEVLHKAQKGT
jgi:hypothetical protein